jgi:hypothetical protein
MGIHKLKLVLAALAAVCALVCMLAVAATPAGASTSAGALAAHPAFTAGEPGVEGTSFSDVGSRSATLSAEIEPAGSPTTYYVEYGPTSAYGARTSVLNLPTTESLTGVTVRLEEDLAPGSEYHFRFIAENASGTHQGADEIFKTLLPGIQGLPDSRVYEMVSPPENQNADVYRPNGPNGEPQDGAEDTHSVLGLFQAASDGNAVAYVGEATSGNGTGEGRSGGGSGNQYLATRGPEGGWTQANLQPAGYVVLRYEGFSSNLSTGMLLASGETTTPGVLLPPLSAEGLGEGYRDLYLRSSSDGSYRPLVTATPPYRGPGEEEYINHDFLDVYAGQSGNGQVTLLEANDALLEGKGPLASEVRDEAKSDVEADQKRREKETTGFAEYSDPMFLYDSVGGQLNLVSVLPDGNSAGNATFGALGLQGLEGRGPNGEYKEMPDRSHVISEDGDRIYWTALGTERVYVREDGTATVPVSMGAARYWTATSDGRYAFYTEGEELWRFDGEGGEGRMGTRMAIGGHGAGVLGVIGASDDGEYVYFTATGVLAAGASEGGANLYLWHAGTTTFIATLAFSDGHQVEPLNGSCTQCKGVGDWSAEMGFRTAEVSSDGHGVVFMSSQSLPAAGYSHGYSNEELQEVYVYEAEGGGHLFCVSCSPSGESPPVREYVQGEGRAAALLPVTLKASYSQQWLSEDGGRVVFDSAEPLVANDTNGKFDVYEWERDGTGSCGESSGCVYLLSSGSGESSSWLVGESASGDDVFIVTRSQLTVQDPNSAYNLFDARVGGVQPVTPPECQGTGCQGLPSASPIFATPPSQTFNGVGNFASTVKAPAHAAKPKKKTKVRRKKKVKTGGRKGKPVVRRSVVSKRTGKGGAGRGK